MAKFNGVDYGDDDAALRSAYFSQLSDAAKSLGLDYYGSGGFLSNPILDSAGVTSSSDFMPYMNLAMDAASPEQLQDQYRYVPAELMTKLWTDKETGNLAGIRDLLGNEDIFKNAKLGLLPSSLSKQLLDRDWAGTNYEFTRPDVGYLLSGELGAKVKADGRTAEWDAFIQPGSSAAIEPMSDYSEERFPWMHSSGASDVFSGENIRRMTPEVQRYLLDNLESYGDRVGSGMIPGRKHTEANWSGPNSGWANDIRNSLWYAQDKETPTNFAFDRGNGDWVTDPYVWSSAGRGQMGGEATVQAQHQASEAEFGLSDLVNSAIMSAVTMGAGAALGPAIGQAFSGATSGGLTGAGTATGAVGEGATLGSLGSGTFGVDLTGAGLYGQTPLMTGGIGSGLSGTSLASLGLDTGALAGASGTGLLSDLTGGIGDTTAAITGNTGGNMDWTDALGDWLDLGGDAAGGYGLGGDLTLEQFLTGSDAVTGLEGFGGAEGIPGMDTLGSTSWLESAYNTLMGGGLSSLPNGTSNVLKALLGDSGEGGASWVKTLGSLGAAGLGAYASNKQTTALEDMAKRYEGYGAPYRQKLSDLYANPDGFLNSKEVQTPVQMGTTNLMRSLSTQGNPFGSGNALQQGQSYASDQLFSRLGQEKDRLAGYGGLSSYSQAAPTAATNAIQSGGNVYGSIASGLGDIFNPRKSSVETMADFFRASRGA